MKSGTQCIHCWNGLKYEIFKDNSPILKMTNKRLFIGVACLVFIVTYLDAAFPIYSTATV